MKPIKAVYWPDSGEGQCRQIIAKDGLSLHLSITYHGDHDEVWIVEMVGVVEVARHNPRYVETIVWEDERDV